MVRLCNAYEVACDGCNRSLRALEVKEATELAVKEGWSYRFESGSRCDYCPDCWKTKK